MIAKRTLIVLLVGVNAFMLAILVAMTYSPRLALAQQRTGRAGDFSCISAKPASQASDVVYILDRPRNKLHAFYAMGNVSSVKYGYGGFRDLDADFNVR